MPETITLHALDLSGETTLKLFLRKDDGTLLNTDGDALTEIGSSGVFQASIGESRTGVGDLSYRVCLATETADNLLIDGFLPETETTIGASSTAVLDSAAQSRISALPTATAGTTGGLALHGASGGGEAGSGARTVTITVNDGTSPIQNAVVRLTVGVFTHRATTTTSGVTTFNVDDATYTVAITRSGYTFAGASLIVDGDETRTYSMTAIVITPAAGDLTTGWLTTRLLGVAKSGVVISYQHVQIPDADTGSSFDSAIYTATSNTSGVAELQLTKGGRYHIWRGTGKKPASSSMILIPANAGSTYELPSHVGL